jgi:hypothetical protein
MMAAAINSKTTWLKMRKHFPTVAICIFAPTLFPEIMGVLHAFGDGIVTLTFYVAAACGALREHPPDAAQTRPLRWLRLHGSPAFDSAAFVSVKAVREVMEGAESQAFGAAEGHTGQLTTC